MCAKSHDTTLTCPTCKVATYCSASCLSLHSPLVCVHLGIRYVDGMRLEDEEADAYEWLKEQVLPGLTTPPPPIPVEGSLDSWLAKHYNAAHTILSLIWALNPDTHGLDPIPDILMDLQDALQARVRTFQVASDHVYDSLFEQIWRTAHHEMVALYKASKKRSAVDAVWQKRMDELESSKKKRRAIFMAGWSDLEVELPREMLQAVAMFMSARDALTLLTSNRDLLARFGNTAPLALLERDFPGVRYFTSSPTQSYLADVAEYPDVHGMLSWVFALRDAHPKDHAYHWFLCSGLAFDLFYNDEEFDNTADLPHQLPLLIPAFPVAQWVSTLEQRFHEMRTGGGHSSRSWLRLCYRAVAYTMAMPMMHLSAASVHIIGADLLHIEISPGGLGPNHVQWEGTKITLAATGWTHDRAGRVLKFLHQANLDPAFYLGSVERLTDFLEFLLTDIDPTVEIIYKVDPVFLPYNFLVPSETRRRGLLLMNKYRVPNTMCASLEYGLRYHFSVTDIYKSLRHDDVPGARAEIRLRGGKDACYGAVFSSMWRKRFWQEVFD